MMWLFFLQLFRLILAQNDTQLLSSDKEKRLLDDILKNYNKNILPPHNSTHPVIITAGLVAVHLHSIDFAEQTLSIESWLKLSWYDKRLEWDERRHNIWGVPFNVNNLWRPDITILNSADSNMIEYAERTTTRHAHIYRDGVAVWVPAQTLKVLCALDITYYPFDTHNCSIKVGSWKFDVDFKLESDREQHVRMSLLCNCTEWEVLDTYAERTTDKIYNVLSGDNNYHNYSYVTFSLKIGRVRSLYHAIILFPLAGGIVLAITAFLVSPFKNERLCLNVFVLFLFIFIMLQLTNIFPSVGRHTPAIVLICESLIILNTLSIVWNVIFLAICGYLASTKLAPFAQKFLNSRPIKFMDQLYRDDACQMDTNSIKVYEETETEAIIKEQIGSTNEWQYFLFILDKLAFIIFTFFVIVILITFCC